ncbi:MAG: DUF1844 domain-containing protein [Blastocatellia bacterium]
MSKNQDIEVTVKDRRMFNPDGSLRQPLAETIEEKPTPPAPPAENTESQPSQETKTRPTAPSQEFAELVQMLATNAIMNLGGAPQLGRGGIDIETARHFIEMLAVLKEKTEGNLTEEEDKMLTDLVSRLRMEYVGVVNQMSKSAKKQV